MNLKIVKYLEFPKKYGHSKILVHSKFNAIYEVENYSQTYTNS